MSLRCFFGHKWKTTERVRLRFERYWMMETTPTVSIGHRLYQQCERCGHVRKVDLV